MVDMELVAREWAGFIVYAWLGRLAAALVELSSPVGVGLRVGTKPCRL